jgi:hypothetical protein
MLFCELALVISIHVKKENYVTMKIKFAKNIHNQILNKISPQCEGISKAVLIIRSVHLHGKREDPV